MLNTENVQDYLREVRAFAKRIGMYDQLEERLRYLDRYANHGQTDKTECVLMKDFAPYSFSFTMRKRARSFDLYVHVCDTCDNVMKTETKHENEDCPDWNSEENCPCKGTLKIVGVDHERTEGGPWFSGGLIFHGPHDNGGDGGMPTLSVNLSEGYGWSIHT